ncbi:PREDICTED: bile acid-coenzyme A ligase-like [Cyphomyrmex costatus]|uniref:bile acid-coenzyme A ligase-like n=1 Tax=Cyphomyrmex costatus TaxID=456900 RepID=UPI00085240F0|nr:PREDICTED: bile acid-coenzyme A ligase-like [Cyphomyrmex costatus]
MATVAQPADVRKHPTSVGRPFSGSRVAVLDDNGKPVRGSAKGRIFVGHHAAFEGYTGGGSKEIINGLVSTGDIGHFERGRLYIDGRDDDMVICGGDNVYPGEVEELLLSHPAVMDACVIGVPDAEFGHRLRAVLALHSGSSLQADEARDFIASQLTEFKVPRDVIFVDEIPRNPTGKVLKRVLGDDKLMPNSIG